MLIETIKANSGEVSIYQDADGYHAERWDDRKQMITEQSGDWPTKIEALQAITACPKCGGDTMLCECVTEHSHAKPIGEPEVETTVAGCQVQHDNSGVGHSWRNIDAENIPAQVRLEIEGEIIDGKKDECDDYVASNGLHYRWA